MQEDYFFAKLYLRVHILPEENIEKIARRRQHVDFIKQCVCQLNAKDNFSSTSSV
jgi:hypothetical protein